MERDETEVLLKRADRADIKRRQFQSLMQDCYRYGMPERDGWNTYGYGADRHVTVYDSTAIYAVPRFANRLQQALVPPQQRWASLQLPPELASDEAAQPIQEDLEQLRNLLFSHIHTSNFDMVANEWAHDLAAGVGCILIENGRLGTKRKRGPVLRFQAVPSALVAFDEGPFGTVEGIFFSQSLPARLVRRTYPDATDLPKTLQEAEDKDPDLKVELLQATYYEPEEDVWCFQVIVKADKHCIVEREYRTCPWIVTRWTKAPGETHGRGPLTQALPDIRTVNKVVELMLKNASIAVTGAWTCMDDGVLNPSTVRIVPGAMIPVRSNGGPSGPSLKALDMPGNFQLSETLTDRLATRIRAALFDDPLPPDVQVGLTATEITERVRRFQADTGAFGRLQTDAVAPIIIRCLDILDEAGELRDPRFARIMEAVQQDVVRVRATSPLSQAQDQADVQAVMSFVGGAAKLGPLGEQMLASGVDLQRAGRYVAEKVGVPHQLIPTEQELAQRQQQAQQQEQQRQVLSSPAAAQVAGALANAAVQPAGNGAAP